MNANQIINMIMRVIMRKAINKGVDMGVSGASNLARKGKARKGAPTNDGTWIDDHGNVQQGGAPDEAQQSRQSKQAAKQAIRAARRAGRS